MSKSSSSSNQKGSHDAPIHRSRNKKRRFYGNRYTRKRKNKETEDEETPKEVPHDAAIEIDDSIETESKLLVDRNSTTVSPNHRPSASQKTNNGFDETLPSRTNGSEEQDFIPEKDTSSIFNRLGYSEDVLSALPNRNWAIHCVEIPEKRIVVSSMVMHNLHGTGLEPLYVKQIVFDEKLNFDLFLINSRLVLKDKPSKIDTMHDFEDLVDYVESLKICDGGPAVSQYSNINPECAYKDPMNKWRHNLCSLEISVGEVCESCFSLNEILRRHVQRTKPMAKFRNSIIVSKRKQRSRD